MKLSLAAGMLLAVGILTAWLQASHVEEKFAEYLGQARAISDTWEDRYAMWAPVIGVLLVHLSLYIGAVLLMILVRRPIFAAVLDAGLLMGLGLLSEYVFRWIGPTDWNGLVIGIPLVLLCMAGAAILAWQAFKKNWSLENWFG